MMGSLNFRLNASRDHNIFWRGNEAEMKRLICELGGDPAQIKPDFFEGTMFWVRPAAFESLRRLKTTERFTVERGAVDGALEHAIERIFAVAVKVAGFRIDDIDGLGNG
jgi:lipopolysaccharide biosynthesis protein